ncbi:hypothetical protein [Pyxidicoccus xibeiensis]|uniref:hypothetical protein n=1 Tax=Pyxidicoccus xibeiensis TaxID=2906759 RepID=UPI0020A7300E|nr:hypothetical protein [Pyxidicoccus xibeiensis]MCP3137326.1 hypothetical protein [Pyxidicoccus xibeiensis]
MKTTRIGMVTVLCGWLAAPMALAQEAEAGHDEVPEEARAALSRDVVAPESMESLLEAEALDSLDAPMLRSAEPLSCPAVPEGRVWVADTEECGESECVRTTTVWLGSWTISDTELEVRCETDRVVLSTLDWQWVLAPDALGELEVAEATPAEPEAVPAEPAGDAAQAPASET